MRHLRLLPHIWAYSRLLPIEGTFFQRRKHWNYNQAHRHVLCEGGITWIVVAWILWRIGRTMELTGHPVIAVSLLITMGMLITGAMALLIGFHVLSWPFDDA